MTVEPIHKKGLFSLIMLKSNLRLEGAMPFFKNVCTQKICLCPLFIVNIADIKYKVSSPQMITYSICFNYFVKQIKSHKNRKLKVVFAIFHQIFIFSPNDSPSKSMENVFLFCLKISFHS